MWGHPHIMSPSFKGGGGHYVLKWGFTQTFPGNQDATFKLIPELTFIKS